MRVDVCGVEHVSLEAGVKGVEGAESSFLWFDVYFCQSTIIPSV